MELIQKFIILSSLMVCLGVASLFIYTDVIYRRPLLSDKGEWEKESKEMAQSVDFKAFKLGKITTNLYSTKTRLRYINMEAHIQPFEEKQMAELEQRKTLIYDTILQVTGENKPEELSSLVGKILFENEIKRKINSKVPRPLVQRIFFSAFVIQ